MTSQENTYSIAKVAEMTGVTKNRIRNWCLQGHLPETEWISLGNRQHRRFTDQHIESIKMIDRFRSEGFELATAAKKASEEITQAKGDKDNG